ncbi:TonB family protein [Brevundimonas sp.]|uniref:TonB family protein n=1 Tax=Brevundimonas sp. TaxID=1871086 RepID=UPI003566D72C
MPGGVSGGHVKPDASWSREPRPDFPERASERGVTTGSVELLCTSQSNGTPTNCSVVFELPSGVGFGEAALRSMRSARFSPATVDAGGSHRFTVSFGED